MKMIESQFPSGEGFHWSTRQRQVADDAVLDAIQAAKEAERDAQIDRPTADLSGIPPWSQASPGVPIAARLAELDQIDEHAHHVDEVDRMFRWLRGHEDNEE